MSKQTWYEAAARPSGLKPDNPRPSPSLERARIQAEVLAPALRAFRAELGTERANRIAWKALAA